MQGSLRHLAVFTEHLPCTSHPDSAARDELAFLLGETENKLTMKQENDRE